MIRLRHPGDPRSNLSTETGNAGIAKLPSRRRRSVGFAFVALFSLILAGCGTVPAGSDVAPIVTSPTTQSDDADDMQTDAGPILVPTTTPAPSATTTAPPEPVDPSTLSLQLEEQITGLNKPLFVTHAGDGSGRLFVVEQPGVIRVVVDGVLQEAPFLDIQDQVNDGGNEQGLLGLAFAPDYATSGLFYVNYTDSTAATQVARFRVAPDAPNQADSTTEERILTIEQPARNHNGGTLAFGPDGMLYVGMGDGGGANDRYGHGQNPDSLLGKLLRIDVSQGDGYRVPADNPWVGTDWNGTDVRDEIVAVGLRNPWRFSFDRATGDLWIGDVGQNQYEEINVVAAPAHTAQNYGWPLMEGTHCFQSDDCDQTGLILPVAEYSHQGHCSVTGGYVYRGDAYPEMDGVYFYGDYCSGMIWALVQDETGTWQSTEIMDSGMSLSSFGEDERGELYVTDLAGGTVARLVVGD